MAYYGLHALGATDWLALLAATAAAGLRITVTAVGSRRVGWFAAVMLITFGVGLAVAFIGGDPRFLLLKDSFSTALLGTLFLASLLTKLPLALAAAQASQPGRAAQLVRLHRVEPAGRRAFRTTTLVWGLGLVGEAVVRVPLIYLLPVSVMVGLPWR